MSALVFPLAALGCKVLGKEPITSTRVDTTASGKEARSSWWLQPKWRYRIGFGSLRADSGSRLDYQQLVGFFGRHAGQLDSFLLQDPEDASVSDHGFGVGDGATTAFQLQRSLLGSAYDQQGGPWPVSSKPRTNMLPRSTAMATSPWATLNATATSGFVAPDGSASAVLLTDNTTSGNHVLYQPSVALVAGTRYTLSVFVRPGTISSLYLKVSDGANTADGYFSLAAASVTSTSVAGLTTAAAGTVVSCPGGWLRVSLSFTCGASGNYEPDLALVSSGGAISYAGTGSYLYLWGAQLEAASAASALISTAASAVTVNPSYWPAYGDGYEPVWEPAPGAVLYLSESAYGVRQLAPWSRTNALKYSQGNGLGWSTSQTPAGITYNSGTAPDGTSTAIQFVEGTSTTPHDLFNVNWQSPGAGRWTGSLYVKRSSGSRNYMLRVQSSNSFGRSAIFDGATGALVATPYPSEAIASGCQVLANGWLRIWCTVDYKTGGAFTPLLSLICCSGSTDNSYTGDGISTTLVWGGHVETGDFLGDYIVTTASTASRTDYTAGSLGAISFGTAPRSGAALSWTGGIYRRVRFEDPTLSLERIVQSIWRGDLALLSVKP